MEQKLIKSVVKAFDIMELLSESDLSLSEISVKLDQNINTVKGLLNTLIHKGYVKQDSARGAYGLGVRILDLAGSMRIENVLKEISAPYLKKLHESSYGEAVYCSLVSGMRYICLDFINCDHELGVHPGKSYEIAKNLHVYAQGKLILANSSEKDLKRYLNANPLSPLTPNSITEIAKLKKQIQKINETGLAITKDESSIGISTMAAGIFSKDGKLTATIALSLPSSRWNKKSETRLGKELLDYAKEISGKICL